MGIPTCVYYPIQEQEFSLGFRNDLGRKMFIEFFNLLIVVVNLYFSNVLVLCTINSHIVLA